jgi:serine/threonine protein kinase
MSPELFFGKVGSDKVDIFSLGIVLYRLAFKGSHPFYDETKRFKSIREYGYYMESCPLRFPSKHDRSKELIDLIKRMLEKDKDKRISWL